ncbi:hypothetical protein PAECIP111894_02828 [Paenibacillus pseudetheri]|uniref:Uncharacterized protein n=1 Tax=Paenibacillus pseudetheri TaxID=2897682 RepID=A0ABN8FLM4_9BACL|nr:hypothetical protein PAECIP111894_02828 [Paenibacillus pseudetheri]
MRAAFGVVSVLKEGKGHDQAHGSDLRVLRRLDRSGLDPAARGARRYNTCITTFLAIYRLTKCKPR